MNYRKFIQIAIFAITLLVVCSNSNAQETGYEYDSGNFGGESVNERGNGGRIASVPSTRPQSTINQNNAYQNSEIYSSTNNNGLYRPSQGLDRNTVANTNGYTNQDINSSAYQNSGQPSHASRRPSITTDNNNYHNSEQAQFAGSGSRLNEYSNNLGPFSSSRPMPASIDRNPVYNNQNTNGLSSFQSTGQGNQRQPALAHQDSRDSSNSYQNEQTLDRNNKNYKSGTNFQGNGQSDQDTQTNKFNPSETSYTTRTSQIITTRSPQFLERDTVYNNNNNGNNNDNYNANSNQWNTNPTKKQNGGGSTFGIIASNDGYVQSRPLMDLDPNTNAYAYTNTGIDNPSNKRNANSNVHINNNSHGSVASSRPTQSTEQISNSYNNGQTESGNNYESNFQPSQGRPINQVKGSDHQNNGNQFFSSENFEDSHESKPVNTINRQNTNNGNNGNNGKNKNKNNSNVSGNDKSNGNGNSHSHGNGKNNNNNSSGEKHSNSKNNNNKHSQVSAGHQGSKPTKKQNVIASINSNKNKKTDSNNGNVKEKSTNNGGNAKKRVSQIKYEQYLTSIFPDLDNEDVQEIKDFRGRQLARPGQFPHMGAIGFKNHVLNKTEYKCGASLISDIWSLTTAHCTNYNGLTPTYVRFGDLNLKAAEEDIDPQTRRISMIVNHPSYNDQSLYNDIALLQLNKIVIFTEFVQPIRIWYQDDIPFTMAYAMGFGAVKFAGAQTNRLTQLELTIVPNDICSSQMPYQSNAQQGIISTQICAIDNKKTKSDTFQGDSGGPLEISFYEREGGRQRQYLIGMTSFGVVGTTRLPGVYTRVSSYVDWIEKTVWSTEYHAQLIS